jgi:hypothetical protein
MRMMLGLALYVLASSVSGCGDDIEDETLIGATCESNDDCDVTGVCVKGPDGLCTLPCDNPGAAQECPLDSYCDSQNVETDGESGDMTLCFPACDSDRDCRNGYQCNGVSSGSGKVCSPKK